MKEYKLAYWADDDEYIYMVGIERVAAKVEIDGDNFKASITLKHVEDQHNRHLENAILNYRLKVRPLTNEVVEDYGFDMSSGFFSFLQESERHKIVLEDLSKEALTEGFLNLALYLYGFHSRDYFKASDFLTAIIEYNQDHTRKIPIPHEFKAEARKILFGESGKSGKVLKFKN